jgi:hypothetical protein
MSDAERNTRRVFDARRKTFTFVEKIFGADGKKRAGVSQ